MCPPDEPDPEDAPVPANPPEAAAERELDNADFEVNPEPDFDARAHVLNVVMDMVRANPDQDIHHSNVIQHAPHPALTTERVTGQLRSIAAAGLIAEHRKAKLLGRRESKDRKIIHYRATPDLIAQINRLDNNHQDQGAAQITSEDKLRFIYTYAQTKGFVCSIEDVVNYFLCLQAKPFVVMSGISGTGKTKLPRIFAEATDSRHTLIPVKPNWSDNSDLMGYYSVTRQDFVPGELIKSIQLASNEPQRSHFVILDEMNLAHVEHYLSDLLSVMETRRRSGNDVVTDYLPLDIPGRADQGVERQEDEEVEKFDQYRNIILPWNLFIIGTVNVDETTHPFSRKVLDRAYVIDFNEVDLMRFDFVAQADLQNVPANDLMNGRPASILDVYHLDPEFFNDITRELSLLNGWLRAADMHFAYRVRDEILLYMWAWRHHQLHNILGRDDALDFCLLQKVLPRCQGSSETARRALEALYRYASVEIPAGNLVANGDEDDGEPADAEQQQVNEDNLADILGEGDDIPDEDAGNAGGDEPEGTPANQLNNAPLDPRRISEPTGDTRWRYPRTARKALRMIKRYVDTGYFAFWS